MDCPPFKDSTKDTRAKGWFLHPVRLKSFQNASAAGPGWVGMHNQSGTWSENQGASSEVSQAEAEVVGLRARQKHLESRVLLLLTHILHDRICQNSRNCGSMRYIG